MEFDIYNSNDLETNINFSQQNCPFEKNFNEIYFNHNKCKLDKNTQKIGKRNTKKHKKHKFFIKFLIILIIFTVLVSSYFSFYVNPQIVESNKAQIKSYAVGLINNAIRETIQNNDYDDLIEIFRDSQNNITLLQVNTKNVNNLNNEILTLVQTGKKSDIPIILVGKEFWNSIFNIKRVAQYGVISKDDKFHLVDTPDEAWNIIAKKYKIK